MNVTKHHRMTHELYTEVLEIYRTLSSSYHFENFPAKKLPVALKALGIEPPNDETEKRANEMEPVNLKEFLKILSEEYLDTMTWMQPAMSRAFRVFDKDGNGYIDPPELKRVFTKLGEHLSDAEMDDQLREYDIDGDNQMVLTEWMKMVLMVRGSDYVFDDA